MEEILSFLYLINLLKPWRILLFRIKALQEVASFFFAIIILLVNSNSIPPRDRQVNTSQASAVLTNQTFNALNQAVNMPQPQTLNSVIGSIAHNIGANHSVSNSAEGFYLKSK